GSARAASDASPPLRTAAPFARTPGAARDPRTCSTARAGEASGTRGRRSPRTRARPTAGSAPGSRVCGLRRGGTARRARPLLRALLADLVPDAGLAHDDPSVHARDDADAAGVDHVVAVGRLLLLPQNLGYDSEHQAAVRFPVVRDQEVELDVAQTHYAYMLV